MRDSPLARQGSAEVPTPLEPLGQSSRSLGGAGGVLGTGGVGMAAAGALGLAGGASFLASSSQPSRSVVNERASSSLDGFIAGDTDSLSNRARRFAAKAGTLPRRCGANQSN